MFGGGPAPPLSERMFKKYDLDNSGSIDSKEFQHLCFSLGYALSTPEINLAVKILDSDGSGTIEMKEFTTWWKKEDRWGPLQLDADAIAVRGKAADTFNEFDSEKKGKIATTDFTRFHQSLIDQKLTTKDRETCLADLDTSGDGAIQFNEYIDWLERIGTIVVKCERDAATGGGMAAVARPKVGGPGGITAGIAAVTLKPSVTRAPSTGPAKTAAAPAPAGPAGLKPTLGRAPSSPAKAEAKAEAAPTGAAGLKPVSAASPKTGAGAGAAAAAAPANPFGASALRPVAGRQTSMPGGAAASTTVAAKK